MRRWPGRLAVKMGGDAWTYAELDRASNRLAHAVLHRLGPENEPVVLLLPQGRQQVAAVLGVLKAGKIYVPLDPAHPPGRLTEAIADTGARLVLTATAHLDLARQACAGAATLHVDALGEDPSHDAPGLRVNPDAGAYIFYTSGSTGRPKGVVDTHRNVLHNVMRYTNSLHLGGEDRLTLLQGPSFSGAVSSLFGALLNGAAVFPFDVAREGPGRVAAWLAAEEVTVYHSVPAIFRHVAPHGASLPTLRLVRLEGDQASVLDLELFRRHFGKNCILVNGLGATECGLVRQFFFTPDRPLPEPIVPIGSPVEDMDIVLLDDAGLAVRDGETGEIAVRSRFLATGYWGRPDLTAARFLADPARPGSRIYRTGDLGRLRPDQLLEHLGREDGAAKVRGQRVEIAEVESALATLPGVTEAAAAVLQEASGEPRLVAYLVSASGSLADVDVLRRALASRLPDFMVPSAFVMLDRLPLNDNRKVDRRALPPPAPTRPGLGVELVLPRTPLESKLAQAWAHVLGVTPIGVHDDFFDLGGDSLRGAVAVARVSDELGVELALEELFHAPTVAELAERIERAGRAPAAPARLPRRDPATPLPLSLPQRRLWFIHRLAPESPVYHVPLAVRMRGPLDHDALRRSLEGLIHRHESLRTVLTVTDGEPGQRVTAPEPFVLPLTDLRRVPVADLDVAMRAAATHEAATPFDLERELPIRARLLRLDVADHVLVVTLHHLAVDSWSLGILARELEALYDAHHSGRPPALPALALQYGDYAVSQRERLGAAEMESQLAYWRGQLADAPILLTLPTDRPRPLAQSFAGAREPVTVSADVVRALRACGRDEGATLYMTVLAAFQGFLSRYADQEDVLVGSPTAGRGRTELDGVIGFFSNTLVLRGDLRGDPTFRELLRRTRRASLDALAHQDLPFERLVEAIHPDRDPGRNPIVQVMLALENAPPAPLAFRDLRTAPVPIELGTAKADLTLALTEEAGELRGALEYSTDLFEGATARRMAAHFLTLLAAIVRDPDQPMSRLPLLTEAERRQILTNGNAVRPTVAPGTSLPAGFAEQAARTPATLAVVDGTRALTYAQLRRRAHRVARYLRARGVAPGQRVGVCLDRSLELVVALLGVVEAGAAYVPLDPAHPSERNDALLADAEATITIAPAVLAELGSEVESEDDTEPMPALTGLDLASVMYTSGSTGVPKGVAVPHHAVLRLVRDTDYVQLGPQDVVALLSNPAFDASTFEIWGALLNGARLAVMPSEAALSPTALAAAIRRHGVTILFLTTALFNEVARETPTAFRGVRQVLFGGEAVEPRWVETILGEGAPMQLLHMYGPTEATTFATWHEVIHVAPGATTIPIGRPVANAEVYVLDRHGEPVPAGVPGEIHIGGPGLARGYLRAPELTAERFVPHPFDPAPGARLYRTGDRARYRADGEIEFLGRLDRQVKVRGFRIEPGEVEAALTRLPEVRAAAVIAVGETSDTRAMVAYVVPQQGARPAPVDLRRGLQRTLPSFMIPSTFVMLDRLPLSSHGKVDYRALPAPSREGEEVAPPSISPRHLTERAIAEIWEDVLGVHPVGIHDSFFDLGGHSLLAARMLDAVERATGRIVPLAALFRNPTIEHLAETLRGAERETGSPLIALNAGGSRPPLFFLHGDFKGGGLYTCALARALGPDQPLFAVHPHGLLDDRVPDSIEAMAADRVADLRVVQATGPYILGGHCNGALVALEMARQLARAGEDVPAVFLLDAAAPSRTMRAMARIAAGVDALRNAPPEQRGKLLLRWRERGEAVGERMAYRRRRLSNFLREDLHGRAVLLGRVIGRRLAGSLARPRVRHGGEAAVTVDEVEARFRHAIGTYLPAPYPGRLVVLPPERTDDRRRDLGWSTVSRRVEVHLVPGDHFTCVTRHVEATAARLHACLARMSRP